MAGFSGYKQSFAAAGFVFVSPNVRGSTGYGKAWLDSDNGPLRLKVITDIEDCAKHIRSQWKINGVSPRVGVMGGSYGGYSTLMAMSKFCLRLMARIERPAIAAIWPTIRGESIVLDVGATIGADAAHLFDMAIMGAAMARIVFDIDRPTVDLRSRRRGD
jgi:predicted acyl esterase